MCLLLNYLRFGFLAKSAAPTRLIDANANASMPIRGFVSDVLEAFFTVAFLATLPVVLAVAEFDFLPVATVTFVPAPLELPAPPDIAPVLHVPLPGVPGFTASFFFKPSIALLSDLTALSTFV